MAKKARAGKTRAEKPQTLDERMTRVEDDIGELAYVLIGLRDQLVTTIFTPPMPPTRTRAQVRTIIIPPHRGLAGPLC